MNYVDNTFKSPVILSLCTGMRGLERGIERAFDKCWRNNNTVKNGTTVHENRNRISVAAYVEIEAFIIYNLVKQMEQGVLDPRPIWSDLKTFPAQFFRGKIHIITGGYPCQPFSVAGKLEGKEDPRHLWPHIESIVDIVRPPIVFFENVANHLNIGYREVRHSLEEMGYSVKEGIYSAEEVGAPHERKRLFILAVAHSYINGYRTRSNGTFKKSGEVEGETQRKERNELLREWMRYVIGNSSQKVGNAESINRRLLLQSRGSQQASAEGRTRDELIHGGEFVAGQGYFQYEWEEKRIVESGVGCTINGYNFRTDLLRMYGNGVVEQTAELAFIDLMNKHFTK